MMHRMNSHVLQIAGSQNFRSRKTSLDNSRMSESERSKSSNEEGYSPSKESTPMNGDQLGEVGDLFKKRQKYVASIRPANIDVNPHKINEVAASLEETPFFESFKQSPTFIGLGKPIKASTPRTNARRTTSEMINPMEEESQLDEDDHELSPDRIHASDF
jgi:DNA-binding transcriptional regulator YhcF (GntR family)